MPPLNPASDNDIFARNEPGLVLPEGLHGGRQTPYVFLAACRRDQKAAERQIAGEKQGIFTNALLDVLENENINQLSYRTLMRKLKMPPDA